MNTIHEKSTLLLVDDLPENLDIIASCLKSEYRILAARDGKKAIHLAETSNPDLILLDIVMPEIDGFAVLHHLKSEMHTKSIPVIFISGVNCRDTIVRGFHEGAQDYITKPFEPAELKVRIETQIKIKKQNEKLNNFNRYLESEIADRTRELEASNKKLKNANIRLNEFSLMKNRFLNIISHELRTPLAVISQYLEIMDQELHSRKYHEYFEDMTKACYRLRSFSDKALLMTQLNTEAYLIKSQEIRLRCIIDDIIKNTMYIWESKMIRFPRLPDNELCVQGDIDLIKFMIQSILENAIQYSHQGGRIYLSSRKISSELTLDIVDEGPGFSKEALHFAFEAFTLGEDPVKIKLGLSLAMCRLIMKAHNGKIEISNTGKGAMVRLIFKNKKEGKKPCMKTRKK